MTLVLVVDDDQDLAEMLGIVLTGAGIDVEMVGRGDEALEAFRETKPDLVLLDVMLPGIDGVEVCKLIRAESMVPIVMLTARGDTQDVVAGLEAGADDYITKPVRPLLLISKVESLLRRLVRSSSSIVENPVISIKIDREKFMVEIKGQSMLLPKKEFELLELLASRPGKVYSREQILTIVWGNDTLVGERTIDVHIRKLREKLGDAYIRTIKGVGYTFSES